MLPSYAIDCHTPPGLVGKYYTKASNGFWHSFYFTTGGYPDPVRVTRRNHNVTEQAYRKCHSEIVESIANHLRSPIMKFMHSRHSLSDASCGG
ncbi:MAG TPA: hypothetical protein VGB76_14065 [Pyrinomonadaceae bacterium]|jgi:hypothetical protein